ncbi:hypothetical protein PVMG_05618 [Plasmodium vivax Mauritania I]|uniref:VIR protein n=2 Tax=Plasmodium vivax TaxID=5855 RepID=A0A0J9TI67_PLAVI|nr:hypothetical protein PVBG_05477 [Plasmodium vivax Brazil I]KMZ94949.1 hypothetical protein PVMG_05618 [Plasmodium vivax Mauritania I]
MYDNFELAKDDCTSLHDFSDIKNDLKIYYIPYDISDKIAKAICFIYNKKKNLTDKFDTDLCPYLYYWIGDKIYSNISETAKFIRIVNMIYEVLNNTNFHNICYPIKVDIDKVTFNNNKLLFDYSMNYKHIHLNTISGATRCDEDYIEFIKQYINIYKDAYFNCTEGDKKKYDCEYFKTLFQNCEQEKLGSFHCTHHKAQPLSSYAQDFVEQTEHSLHVPRGSERNNALVRIPVSRGDNARHERKGPHKNPGLSEHNVLDSTFSHNTNNTTEGGSSKTIAGSIVPVLGVSSFSLLLYKVTPVGGYINRLLGRNRNMYNPMEYMDALNPYNEGMDPVNRRMNISYNRL